MILFRFFFLCPVYQSASLATSPMPESINSEFGLVRPSVYVVLIFLPNLCPRQFVSPLTFSFCFYFWIKYHFFSVSFYLVTLANPKFLYVIFVTRVVQNWNCFVNFPVSGLTIVFFYIVLFFSWLTVCYHVYYFFWKLLVCLPLMPRGHVQ